MKERQIRTERKAYGERRREDGEELRAQLVLFSLQKLLVDVAKLRGCPGKLVLLIHLSP